MTSVAFFDEGRRKDHHPILGMGGFVCGASALPFLESEWMKARAFLGIDPTVTLRYAMTWGDKAHRIALIEHVPKLGVPLRAVAALLEDFRPEYKTKERRKDMYIQRRAFEYVLQRLAAPQYAPVSPGPHFVFVDRHDDFKCYDAEYAKAWRHGWNFFGSKVPSLQEVGYVSCAASMSSGPAMEIADLVFSVAIRWAEAMVALERGKIVKDLAELQRGMRALLPLFPRNHDGVEPSWRGFSLIAHRDKRTGKEIIYDRIDGWLWPFLSPSSMPSAA